MDSKAAVAGAQRAQQAILKQCEDAGCEAPPYVLQELVGKGSFGRVYKANATATGQVVAVKIISIEEGDTPDPRADTIGDIIKEIGTLKLLSDSEAKNIKLGAQERILDQMQQINICRCSSRATWMDLSMKV